MEAAQPFCPDFIIKVTDTAKDGESYGNGCKPDVMFYRSNAVPGKTKPTSFALAELIVEFKLKAYNDPFKFLQLQRNEAAPLDEIQDDCPSESSRSIIGQIALYAAAHLEGQFRAFAFSLIICGDMARFIRWDRSGAIVSASFNYVADPTLLVSFLQRFNAASDEMRGRDTSVTIPTPDLAEEARAAFGLSAGEKVLQFEVKDEQGVAKHYIGGPVKPMGLSVAGRCTRAFPVYCTTTKELRYMKDTWRVDNSRHEKEADVLRKLKEKQVRNIPTVDHSGDVRNHRTLCKDFLAEGHAWINKNHLKGFTNHRHYRLVMNEVGTPLTKFPSVQVLLTAFIDAMEGAD